jgi:hypothetical protein
VNEKEFAQMKLHQSYITATRVLSQEKNDNRNRVEKRSGFFPSDLWIQGQWSRLLTVK